MRKNLLIAARSWDIKKRVQTRFLCAAQHAVTDGSDVIENPALLETERSTTETPSETVDDTQEATSEDFADEPIEIPLKTTRSGRQVKFNLRNDYKYF